MSLWGSHEKAAGFINLHSGETGGSDPAAETNKIGGGSEFLL